MSLTRTSFYSTGALAALFLVGCSGDSGADTTLPEPVLAAAAPDQNDALDPDPVLDPDPEPEPDADADGDISPVRGIRRPRPPRPPRPDPRPELENRTIDGSNNNLATPQMGAAGVTLDRISDPAYADGLATPSGASRPNARAISNAVAAQTANLINTFRTTDFLWQWGQFLDHDIDLTDGVDPAEPANIMVPPGDIWFDPAGRGGVLIPMNRSIYEPDLLPRQQLNEVTAWIDASQVYGSEDERAEALREHDGSGKLKVSAGNLLPFNEEGLSNAGGSGPELFVAGDVRANEQTGLAVMHTLFVREHNFQAERIAQDNPDWTGDEIYEQARALVAAQMQVITYEEFLPALLGDNALPRYTGYDSSINAGIANEFAHAAYRLGHSMLSEFVLRLDRNGNEIEHGHLGLRDAFFRPGAILDEGGIEPVLRGLAAQRHQRIDPQVVDDVRNFLFGPPGAGGFDLATLNIARGRDHGIGSYNQVRDALGLGARADFADVSSDPDVVARLMSVYASVDDIDLWVGGLSEDPINDSQLGEVFHFIVADQFRRLRDGDRYWYERVLTRQDIDRVERRRLSDVIRDNTSIDDEISNDVFRLRQ